MMRSFSYLFISRMRFLPLLVFGTMLLTGCNPVDKDETVPPAQQNRNFQSEMDKKHGQLWTADERQRANTGATVSYLSQVEKEVFYYINLLRINPARFASSYAKDYTGVVGWTNGYGFDERKASLIQELTALPPLPILKPNETLFGSADCFATSGGQMGLTGHDRTGTGCEANAGLAECTSCGGYVTGLSVVMDFLIDAGESNSGLGHRRILLSSDYEWMGAAIRKHKNYDQMVVLNLDSRNL